MSAGAWLKHPGYPPPMASSVKEVPASVYQISGVTRDVAGAVVPFCTVKVFRKSDDTLIETTTSSSEGRYDFALVPRVGTYYVIAFKPGAPGLAGIAADVVV